MFLANDKLPLWKRQRPPERFKEEFVASHDLTIPKGLIEAGVDLTSNPKVLRSAVKFCSNLRRGETHATVELLLSNGSDARRCKGLLVDAVRNCAEWDDDAVDENLRHVECLLKAGAGRGEDLGRAMEVALHAEQYRLLHVLLNSDRDRSGMRECSRRLGSRHEAELVTEFARIVPSSDAQEIFEHALCGGISHEHRSEVLNFAARMVAQGAKGYRLDDNATLNLSPLLGDPPQGAIEKEATTSPSIRAVQNELNEICSQRVPPLMYAMWTGNLTTLKDLLADGVSPSDRSNQAIAYAAGRSGIFGLESAKQLVEAGADPMVFGIGLDIKPDYFGARYLQLMSEVMNPESNLFIRKIDSRYQKNYINFSHSSYTRSKVFTYVSNCAAVAAVLGASYDEPGIFTSFVRNGAEKVFGERRGSFTELARYTTMELTGLDKFQDVSDAFARQVLLPAATSILGERLKVAAIGCGVYDLNKIVTAELAPLARKILFEGRPLLEVLRLNKEWHRPNNRLPLTAQPLLMNADWYPLLPRTELSNGYSIVPLTSRADLVEEGTALNHCVGEGSYSAQCLGGSVHLLSLRHNNERVGTLMLIPTDAQDSEFKVKATNLKVAAFKGPLNREPLDSEVRALEELKQLCLSGAVKFSDNIGESLHSRNSRESSSISSLEVVAGIRFGEFPSAAVNHYSRTLAIRPTKPGLGGERIPLLRASNFAQYEEQFRAFAAALLYERDDRSSDW